MKREFLQEIRVGDQGLPKEVIDAIMAEHGRDVEAAKAWKEKYDQAVQEHQAALKQRDFDYALESAIAAAKGRSAKAITALLDVEALRQSEDPRTDIRSALEELKQESGYLFAVEPTPPPYAFGTGTESPRQYTMEELSRMSMEEYAAWRMPEED